MLPDIPANFYVKIKISPKFQNTGDISGGEDASYEIKISHEEASINSNCKSHRSHKLVTFSKAIAAGARDTSSTPVTHNAHDYSRLLWKKQIFSTAFMQNT